MSSLFHTPDEGRTEPSGDSLLGGKPVSDECSAGSKPELFPPDRPAMRALKRTECACLRCVACCKVKPGMLLPEDLGRLIPAGVDPYEWAEEHLVASPGSIACLGTTAYIRIGALKPKCQRSSLACHWLSDDNKCKVWQDAPFGCAYFTNHPNDQKAAEHEVMLSLIMHDVFMPYSRPSKELSVYKDMWSHLMGLGCTSEVWPVYAPILIAAAFTLLMELQDDEALVGLVDVLDPHVTGLSTMSLETAEEILGYGPNAKPNWSLVRSLADPRRVAMYQMLLPSKPRDFYTLAWSSVQGSLTIEGRYQCT